MVGISGTLEDASTVLTALFLRGVAPLGIQRRKWPMVESALRRSGASLGRASQALADEGLWAEATALERPGLLAWAEQLVGQGQVLSVLDSCYPVRWRGLGSGAPPVLWRMGYLPPGPFVAIVGSRQVDAKVLRFARAAARSASELGFAVISGGAAGCDSAAALAACSVVEVLPYGIEHHRSRKPALSVCAPDQPFSAGNAMERNTLIYAAAEQAVVVHARFREGGTWTGATDALRRRLCPMLVREDGSQAARALTALGARPLSDPSELAEAMARSSVQGALL